MIRYYAHANDYLEICRCYRAVYETPSVQEDPARWKEVGPASSLPVAMACHSGLGLGVVTSIIRRSGRLGAGGPCGMERGRVPKVWCTVLGRSECLFHGVVTACAV